ncbi:MAG: DUF4837 family protein [Bacteroidaceae bacterium]|nr:DUF4837 family protein [Bacteroidaceae bacterium]
MKRLSTLSLIAVLCAVLFTGCKKTSIVPQASGKPYEVMVVIDHDLWERPAGRAIYDVLDTDVPGLPQSEPSFHISQVAPKDFNYTMKLFRNIIEVHIDPKQFSTTRIKFSRNIYAHDQIYMTINSPSEDDLVRFMATHTRDVLDVFNNSEINRLCVNLKTKYSLVTYKKTQEIFKCKFYAPQELKKSKTGNHFLWTSNDEAAGMVNICVYSYPYDGPSSFNKKYIMHKRDSIMALNIPGSEPDMYMQTDTLHTDVKPIMVHGRYAYEARGLWYMRNEAMGGPFVSHSRVDEKNNRVITVEGFVYAPEKMKRGLMRRLEGSLYTLLLPDEEAEEVPEESAKVPTEENK